MADIVLPAPATGIPQQEYDDLVDEVTAWVSGPGEEWAERIEAEDTVPRDLFAELRDRGYLGMAAPAELGGRGLTFTQWMGLMRIFSRSHASIRMLVHVLNGTWRAVVPYANQEQIERFVKPMIAGDALVAFTLTEPGNGSGADITTRVRRDQDVYRLTGRKHMITFGVSCDYWLLFARLEGTRGADGLVGLLVDRHTPGVVVEDMSDTMGVRGTDHARLHFQDAPVPITHRLGAEGDGLAMALGGFLTPSRISVAMSCVGLAERAQQLAVDYARRRVTFGKPLTSRQSIAFLIAENAADIAATAQLVLHAARRWEEGAQDAAALSSMAKLTAVDMLTRVTDKALQVHGGIGYWRDSPIERVYRDARAQRFEEGTNEIQKTVIARAVFAAAAEEAR